MLFENNTEDEIFKKELPYYLHFCYLSDHILDCQNLVKQGKLSNRGETESDFQTHRSNADQSTIPYSSKQ